MYEGWPYMDNHAGLNQLDLLITITLHACFQVAMATCMHVPLSKLIPYDGLQHYDGRLTQNLYNVTLFSPYFFLI